MDHFFIFVGHNPTKQNLISENEDAAIPGYGRWRKAEVKAVLPDDALWLRATHCFVEVADRDGTPLPPPAASPPPKPKRRGRSPSRS